jgi:3-isopropylmalate/(R)-2-methylmalate dehydratase small subunit
MLNLIQHLYINFEEIPDQVRDDKLTMSEEKLAKIISTAVPLYLENVDTDQIYPARFLRTTDKVGLSDMLFHDWRFSPSGRKIADFILNDPRYKGEILIAGKNFGCGSSREHAAWALKQYGFNVIVSNSFGDIFKHNALNNFLLPVEVSDKFLMKLFEDVEKNPNTMIEIDLPVQEIRVPSSQLMQKFQINPYKKECFMNGYDDMDYILSMKKNIEEFESNRKNDFSLV